MVVDLIIGKLVAIIGSVLTFFNTGASVVGGGIVVGGWETIRRGIKMTRLDFISFREYK